MNCNIQQQPQPSFLVQSKLGSARDETHKSRTTETKQR
jgi:hypothetical protein